MACIGCVIGAAGFAAMYGGGKLVQWAGDFRRNAAMKRVAQGEDLPEADRPDAESRERERRHETRQSPVVVGAG